jgi:hypothetical protein
MEHTTTSKHNLATCESILVTLLASGLKQDLFAKLSMIQFMDAVTAIGGDVDSLTHRETTTAVVFSDLFMKAVNKHLADSLPKEEVANV